MTNLVLGKVWELRLECRLLADDVSATSTSKEIVVACSKGDGIITGSKLIGIVTKKRLLAGKEIVGRWFGAGVLDVGLG